MNKKAYGFTIVELLIVIVVIAILAAITIVTYNGVQKRAQTQLYNSSVDAIEKSLTASATTDKAAFINSVITYDGQDYVGFGIATFCAAKTADLPARDGFAQGECMTLTYGEEVNQSYTANDALFDALFSSGVAPYRSKVFAPVRLEVEGVYRKARAPLIILVAVNDVSDSVSGTIAWLTPDQSSCGRGNGLLKESYEAAQRVIEDGVPIVDAGFGSSVTLEEVQFMYDTYGSLGDLCAVNINPN